MKNKGIAIGIIIALLMVSSCSTIPEEHKGAATGAGVGAAVGAAAGAILGGDTKSTVVGGLLGALIGGAIGHYAYDRTRTREETAQTYNYSPQNGTVLTIEKVSAEPQTVNPGEVVELNMTYAVLNPDQGVRTELTEIREITHEGELVGRPEVRVNHLDGTYTSTIPLHLPADAHKGVYKVTARVESQRAKDVRMMEFYVN